MMGMLSDVLLNLYHEVLVPNPILPTVPSQGYMPTRSYISTAYEKYTQNSLVNYMCIITVLTVTASEYTDIGYLLKGYVMHII